jgi:predicted nicotinamide N-methyase
LPDPARFVLGATRPGAAPLVPEVALRLADEPFALWERGGGELPYWAFAWAGGQALARHVLDRPGLVAGRSVLDVANGGGIVAVAAALAGARHVAAVDVDEWAVAAAGLNAAANGVDVAVRREDVLDGAGGDAEVVLAGDVCYDRAMAGRVAAFAARARSRGAVVLLGDPGRAHFPTVGFREVGRYVVPSTGALEAGDATPTTVWEAV